MESTSYENLETILSPRNAKIKKQFKKVEQLHIDTLAVLRRYESGKDAGAFMGISPSGISLCCTGARESFTGFRWRFYEGSFFFAFIFCTYVCIL